MSRQNFGKIRRSYQDFFTVVSQEGEANATRTELEEAAVEARSAEDRAKKAMVEAAKLAEELRAEQEHAQAFETQTKNKFKGFI